jgi:hypothetical protein
MKQTVVAVFDSPLRANEAVHVLVKARFDAERLPRIAPAPSPSSRPAHVPLWDALVRRFHDFMDADMYLQPYASALAQGRFVVKVHALDDSEASAAQRILEAGGGREIDLLADEWVRG